MRRWLFIGICALIGLFAPASLLWASECLAPSPTVQAGHDPYAPVASRNLTDTELEQTRKRLISLRGDWRGTGDALLCRSLRDPKDAERIRYTLRARVDTDHFGNMVVRVDLYNIDQKISHQETFRLYLKDQRLRHEDNGGAGDVEIKTLTADRIRFLWRVVLPAGSSQGSTRKEYDILIAGDQDAFSIVRSIYTQGKFSSRYTWHLQRH